MHESNIACYMLYTVANSAVAVCLHLVLLMAMHSYSYFFKINVGSIFRAEYPACFQPAIKEKDYHAAYEKNF